MQRCWRLGTVSRSSDSLAVPGIVFRSIPHQLPHFPTPPGNDEAGEERAEVQKAAEEAKSELSALVERVQVERVKIVGKRGEQAAVIEARVHEKIKGVEDLTAEL